MTYFVRGTLAIERDASTGTGTSTLKISVTPGAGFLTPEGAPHAIAFPVPPPNQAASDVAKLIPLAENKFECDAAALAGDLVALMMIAAQQKLIEIRVEPATPPATPAWKLVGFTFPVS